MTTTSIDEPAGRRSLRTTLVASAIVVGTCMMGACTSAPTGPPTAAAPDELSPFVELAVQRLGTADDVAGAKWHTGASVTDREREQAVVKAARAGAVTRGLDPAAVEAVFRDQIEANKVVQYGLLSAWSADPSQAPTATPDLSRIRPELDRITPAILDALAATRDARAAATCPGLRDRAVTAATARAPVDALHGRGLDRALASTCR